MYRQFFGFKEKPFEITADPRFLYLSESHKEALAHLVYAVQEKKGFAVVTGEVGTGKTTLIQTLLGRLDGNIRTAFLFNPKLDSNEDFLHFICEDLEIKMNRGTKGDYLVQLNNFLMDCYTRNINVILIIDEAQTLSAPLLEEVRLLTNLETPKSKLLQVLLIGQPELDDTLDQPQFRPLKQRISVRYSLKPLNQEETKEYIKRRLRVAGSKSTYLFTPKALKEIYRFSRGIPRLVNIVCDNALINGYASERKIIGDDIIGEVVSDLTGGPRRRFGGTSKRLLIASALTVCIVFLLAVVYFWAPPAFLQNLLDGMETGWQHVKGWAKLS